MGRGCSYPVGTVFSIVRFGVDLILDDPLFVFTIVTQLYKYNCQMPKNKDILLLLNYVKEQTSIMFIKSNCH